MDWTKFTELFHTDPGFVEICLRLLCAMLVGLIIGIEREYTNRPAGMRTHILVALGACAVSVTGELLFREYHQFYGASPDPARLSAQVVTGVGFLGAGTILREGSSVKGLTTAASVWAVACLGIASGFGHYTLALIGTVFILFTLTFLEVVQNVLINSHRTQEEYTIETTDIGRVMAVLNDHTYPERFSIRNLAVQQTACGHRITFHATFTGGGIKQHRKKLMEVLLTTPEITSVHCASEESVSRS